MQSLDDLVRDLVDRWTGDEQHPGDGGPGLIHRLDNPALRTTQPRETGGHSAPGSRPPGPLDAVSWSRQVKEEARALDAELREWGREQRWDKALKALPAGAENADRVGEVMSRVGIWHSTARTILGLQSPAEHFEKALCLRCDQRTVYGRADDDRPRAWCTNPGCKDPDTGRRTTFEGVYLDLVARNFATPENTMPDKEPAERTELLRRALQQAEAQESGLSGLYWKLREARSEAAQAAERAAEATGALAQQLRRDLDQLTENRAP